MVDRIHKIPFLFVVILNILYNLLQFFDGFCFGWCANFELRIIVAISRFKPYVAVISRHSSTYPLTFPLQLRP